MDKRKLLTRQNYSKIIKLYTQDFGKDYEHFEFIDKLVDLLKKENLENKEIVDLGTGPGNVIDYLYGKGLRKLTAVDITPEFCDLVREKYKKDKNVRIVCGDMADYLKKAKDSSIAAYIASYSIIHIPDEEVDEVFTQIKRTLMPGGLFMMSCHKGTTKNMEADLYQIQKDPRLKVKEKLVSYMNYFTEHELKERIKKAGLNLLRMETFEPKGCTGDFPVPKIFLITQKFK